MPCGRTPGGRRSRVDDGRSDATCARATRRAFTRHAARSRDTPQRTLLFMSEKVMDKNIGNFPMFLSTKLPARNAPAKTAGQRVACFPARDPSPARGRKSRKIDPILSMTFRLIFGFAPCAALAPPGAPERRRPPRVGSPVVRPPPRAGARPKDDGRSVRASTKCGVAPGHSDAPPVEPGANRSRRTVSRTAQSSIGPRRPPDPHAGARVRRSRRTEKSRIPARFSTYGRTS